MIYGLQYLRGIAALLVVLLHAKVAVNHFVPSSKLLLPDEGFIEFGKYGVDIFFVISGMVMYLTMGKSMKSDRGIGNFIIKRLIRVVPAFWMALGLYGAAMLNAWQGVPPTRTSGASTSPARTASAILVMSPRLVTSGQ